MTIVERLAGVVGARNALTGDDAQGYRQDWTGAYAWEPLCVVKPASTAEVSEVMKIAHETGTPVVPLGGQTGLTGATEGQGAIMLSLERMTAIREIRGPARLAIVEAGVILTELHEAAEAMGLAFPLTFGARGSARIGGVLSTNAGGSNVVRYGNTRDLVLGLEAVLADGTVVDLMSELHKDNSGYNLKHLLIGSEGTLGVITAAVVKLVPRPRAFATAMVAVETLDDALDLLNRLQEASGGAVEAFEYMSPRYMAEYLARFPEARAPFEKPQEVTLLVELGAVAPRDAVPGDDGQVPMAALLEHELGTLLEAGRLRDAVVAQNDAQRAEMWARREAAAEVVTRATMVNNDIALPLDKVSIFLDEMPGKLATLDPEAVVLTVAHLGDGNLHYSVWPGNTDPGARDAIMEAVEEEVLRLGGSFSAEHGIGLTKLPSMRRRKDPAALAAMRAIKAALDPKGILNPGKLLPPEG